MPVKIRIHSRLYAELLDKGGFDLIACYVHIKGNRNKREACVPVLNSRNKYLRRYAMLSKLTGISRPTLTKLVPKLIELGLCYWNSNGGLQIVGWNKIIKKYKKGNEKVKLLPVKLCESYSDTKIAAKYIIIKSNIDKQHRAIDLKCKLLEIRDKIKKGNKLKTSEYLIYKEHKDLIKGQVRYSLLKDATLSNETIAKKIYGEDGTKQQGAYLQKRLNQIGCILSKERYTGLKMAKIDYSEYAYIRKNSNNPKLNYYQGRIFEQESNLIYDLTDKEKEMKDVPLDKSPFFAYLINGITFNRTSSIYVLNDNYQEDGINNFHCIWK